MCPRSTARVPFRVDLVEDIIPEQLELVTLAVLGPHGVALVLAALVDGAQLADQPDEACVLQLAVQLRSALLSSAGEGRVERCRSCALTIRPRNSSMRFAGQATSGELFPLCCSRLLLRCRELRSQRTAPVSSCEYLTAISASSAAPEGVVHVHVDGMVEARAKMLAELQKVLLLELGRRLLVPQDAQHRARPGQPAVCGPCL